MVVADMFASARSFLRRANHHITDFKSVVGSGNIDKPYTVVPERDADTGVFRECFSDDISCILFDAVNNLRACLDHMTVAIAAKHRGGDDFVSFPFSDNAANRLNIIRRKRLPDHVPAEIVALFESFKPYKGGNDTLWAVNHLANVKKHAILVPVNFGVTIIQIPAGSKLPPFAITPVERSKKDEIVIFRSSEPFNRHPNIEVTYSIDIDYP